MQYPDIREYITFVFSMLEAFFISEEAISKRGRPQTYPDASLIVFYAVMTLKGITVMRAQQTYLFHHPLYLERCRLPACPTYVTLGCRYKALTPKLKAFTEYIAASTDARLALCCHLSGTWCPRIAARNVNESPMGITSAKHHTH